MAENFKYGRMKNKTIYFLGLIILITFPFLKSEAQLLNNEISVVAEYSPKMVFTGDQMLIVEDFQYPSLYPNFNESSGGSLKVMVNFSSYVSTGMEYQVVQASKWECKDYEDYNGSGIVLHSLSPVFQIHNKFYESGVFNRLRLIIEVSPTVGISGISVVNPLFDIQGQNSIISQPMKSSDIFYGIKGRIGMEFAISGLFGMSFSYSIQKNWINSKLYVDDTFSYSNAAVGVVIRLEKDKRFHY